MPTLTLVTYQARPGSEEELAGLLRTHVARLRELGLVADRPHFVCKREDKPGTFVESFWWAHPGAADLARDHGEASEMWMRVEDLCLSIDRAHLLPLE
jgi:hypothetical protein